MISVDDLAYVRPYHLAWQMNAQWYLTMTPYHACLVVPYHLDPFGPDSAYLAQILHWYGGYSFTTLKWPEEQDEYPKWLHLPSFTHSLNLIYKISPLDVTKSFTHSFHRTFTAESSMVVPWWFLRDPSSLVPWPWFLPMALNGSARRPSWWSTWRNPSRPGPGRRTSGSWRCQVTLRGQGRWGARYRWKDVGSTSSETGFAKAKVVVSVSNARVE